MKKRIQRLAARSLAASAFALGLFSANAGFAAGVGPCAVPPCGNPPCNNPSTQYLYSSSLGLNNGTGAGDHTYYEGRATDVVRPAPAANWNQVGYVENAADWLAPIGTGIPQVGVASLPTAADPAWSGVLLSSANTVGIPNTSGCCHSDATHADWIAPFLPNRVCNPGYPWYYSGDVWYLRREFKTQGNVGSARIQVAVDNLMEVFVDGVKVGDAGGYYATDADTFTVNLGPGPNHVLGFKVLNHDDCSQTGLAYVMEVTFCGGGGLN